MLFLLVSCCFFLLFHVLFLYPYLCELVKLFMVPLENNNLNASKVAEYSHQFCCLFVISGQFVSSLFRLLQSISSRMAVRYSCMLASLWHAVFTELTAFKT